MKKLKSNISLLIIFQVKRELAPIQKSDKKNDKPMSIDNTETKVNSVTHKTVPVLPPITTNSESNKPVEDNEDDTDDTRDLDNHNDAKIPPNDCITKETNFAADSETKASMSPRGVRIT